ncbi:MAG TPA: methyltransferase [Polyangiaceae bacterium]|nr:methyltransferase [Polyangiaceae bacterium]
MPLPSLAGLDPISGDTCEKLLARFRFTGFTSKLVSEADGFFSGTLRAPRLPIVRFWLERRPEPGATLARLFVYDATLGETEARDALSPELFEHLLDAGVVERSGGGVRSLFLVHPVDPGIYVLSDRLDAGRDAVMGPGGGTEHLARLVPAAFEGRALDLGCGAGTLALVAARRGAKRAVGVDLNPRAIELSRFNTRLNGLDAEFFAGNGVEPVENESFDLVLSQPPFVGRPSEQEERTFLFGGARGDELALAFLAAVPSVLAPGGRAFFLLQSAEREGEPLTTRVRRVLGDSAPHLLVLSGGGPTPATQASVFASFEDPSFGEEYARSARRYLEHFEKLGIAAFGGALVVLSRPTPALGDGRYALGLTLRGPHYDAVSLETFLRSLDLVETPDDVLERSQLRLSPHVRSTLELVDDPNAPGTPAQSAVLRVAAPGIGSDWPVAPAELEVLRAIDASPSVRAALDAIVQAAPALASLRDELLGFVRNALLRGALVRGG